MKPLLLVLALATNLEAQTVNPRHAEFYASTDHDTLLVTGYELQIFNVGASQPISHIDLGKPTPDANRHIVATPTELIGLPVGVLFEARVVAQGPGGEGISQPSNSFLAATSTGCTGGSSDEMTFLFAGTFAWTNAYHAWLALFNGELTSQTMQIYLYPENGAAISLSRTILAKRHQQVELHTLFSSGAFGLEVVCHGRCAATVTEWAADYTKTFGVINPIPFCRA